MKTIPRINVTSYAITLLYRTFVATNVALFVQPGTFPFQLPTNLTNIYFCYFIHHIFTNAKKSQSCSCICYIISLKVKHVAITLSNLKKTFLETVLPGILNWCPLAIQHSITSRIGFPFEELVISKSHSIEKKTSY